MIGHQQTPPTPPRASTRAILESLPREHGFEPLRVEGTLPPSLRGTLFRNGPALASRFGKRYDHVFEGDGAVSAVRFDGGEAMGAVRFVRTERFEEEARAQKHLYTKASWPKRMWNAWRGRSKNPSNVNVMLWRGRLFALPEMAAPVELDPETLDTIGALEPEDLSLATHCAHPHTHPRRRSIISYNVIYGKASRLEVVELPFEGSPRVVGQIPMAEPRYTHDFIVTDKHAIFFLSPVFIDFKRVLLQIGGFTDFVRWREGAGTEIVVVPLDGGSIARFEVEPFFQWHFSNAFEAKDGTLVVDYVRYNNFDSINDLRFENTLSMADKGKLHRARLDLKARTFASEPLWEQSCEFPRIHPDVAGLDARWSWLVDIPNEGERAVLGKVDVHKSSAKVWRFEDHLLPTEAIFAPRKDAEAEDDGHVVTLVYDRLTHTSGAMVFDGRAPSIGPVGAAWFDHHIPLTFHGDWSPMP